jgi:aldose 1-epimerase
VTPAGEAVDIVTLSRERGVEASVITFGAAIQSLWAADWSGDRTNVVLGYPDLSGYEGSTSAYLGATVGRYANRIAEGRFTLDGKTHQLARNEGRHHLHGGRNGFDKKVWRPRTQVSAEEVSVTLARTSDDGEEGYPGALDVEVTYALRLDDTLAIRYRAVASEPTVVNLTNHALFNLAGTGTILDHSLQLSADAYTPVDSEMIPTGEIASVDGTPMDFRAPHRIRDRIAASFEQLTFGGGYDHNYVLSDRDPDAPAFAARLQDDKSGRSLEVWTREPGLQVYTGNRLDGTLTGVGGFVYERFAGIALETQKYPDSPNHDQFPSSVLHPSAPYESVTELRFKAERPMEWL